MLQYSFCFKVLFVDQKKEIEKHAEYTYATILCHINVCYIENVQKLNRIFRITSQHSVFGFLDII